MSGALAPLLQQIPEVYFFGVGDMGICYNLLALVIRMASGAVYAIILVKPIALALAKAGVLRGTAVAKEEATSANRRFSPRRPEAAVLTLRDATTVAGTERRLRRRLSDRGGVGRSARSAGLPAQGTQAGSHAA